MNRHHESAMKIAHALEGKKGFKEVIFPGLEAHPQHKLALKQMSGFSGMLSIRLNGGMNETRKFLSQLKIFSLAESLGGVESLANHPETMTHASVPADHRKKIGITSDLIRLSVGIEDADELSEELIRAGASL